MFWEALARRAFGFDTHHDTSSRPVAVTSPADILGTDTPSPARKIGLALGGGAARGWAHLGVLEVLREEGILPDVIVGTSIGAVVGGCFAAGRMDALKDFARSLTKRRILGLMDFQFGGSGLIRGHKLTQLLDRNLRGRRIENLDLAFAAIATEIGTGHEIWLTKGNITDALRASYALPGVFPSIQIGGRWLMDGALVNPVPVTAVRALGAELVIAINLNGDLRLRGTIIQSHGGESCDAVVEALPEKPRRSGFFAPVLNVARPLPGPGLTSVMIDAFNITQDRITRSRLAGDPPDVMVTPRLADIGLFEFHKAEQAIASGRTAMERVMPEVRLFLKALHAVPD
jgi:NTE family protein